MYSTSLGVYGLNESLRLLVLGESVQHRGEERELVSKGRKFESAHLAITTSADFFIFTEIIGGLS